MIGKWGPVVMWVKLGEPVGTPCGQARGQAEPVHRLSNQRLSTGRAKRAEWSRSDHPHIHGFG